MSTDTVYRDIAANPKFKTLVRRRSRFAWALSSVMLFAYFAFIILIGFDPRSLGEPVRAGGTITWGIVAGLGLIVLSFALTGIYVSQANGVYDRLVREILEEAGQ